MDASDASDDAKIRAVFENIAASWARLDVAAWLENFHAPRMIVTPRACMRPASAEEAET